MVESLQQLKATFDDQGFVVVPGLLPEALREQLLGIAAEHLAMKLAPVEYEVDVHYPGSPLDDTSEGAETARRLLQTYSEHSAFREWGTADQIKAILSELFGHGEVLLSQCHHNCVMTKQPGFSSVTRWHQDIRYWHFDRQDLISVWSALGDESKEMAACGCCQEAIGGPWILGNLMLRDSSALT